MEKELRRFFESHIFKRGERYFAGGRVGVLKIETTAKGSIAVGATVSGSARYTTSLLFDPMRESFLGFDCSCPYDDNCKHAVALGLAFIAKRGERSESTLAFTSERAQAIWGSTPRLTGAGLDKRSEFKSRGSDPRAVPYIEKYTKEHDGVVDKAQERKPLADSEEEQSKQKMITALSAASSAEDIEKLIIDLREFQQKKVQQSLPGLELSPAEYVSYVSGKKKLEKKPEPFTLKGYFVAFSKWNKTISLRHEHDPHQYASISKVLKRKGDLTDKQVELMMLLKQSQGAGDDSAPANLGKALMLVKESGMPLCGEYYYNNRDALYIDDRPPKIPATLSFKEEYDGLKRERPRFVLTLPEKYAQRNTLTCIASDEHLVVVSKNAVELHPMSQALSCIVARAKDPSIYSQESAPKDGGGAQTIFNDEETIQINSIIIDAKKYLDLSSEIVSGYDIEGYDAVKKILVVDFCNAEESLSIYPAVDYGFHEQDVSQSVYVSRVGGKVSFKRRSNYRDDYSYDSDPDTHIINIKDKKICHAPIRAEMEEAFFGELYDSGILPKKTPRVNLRGLDAIAQFYEEYWPRVRKKCDKIDCEVRFVRDEFSFGAEAFRADLSIDMNADKDWLSFDASLYLGPDKITLEDLIRFIEEGQTFFRQSDGRLLRITNREDLERFVAMLESFSRRENGQFEGRLYRAPEIEYIATSSEHYNAVRSKGFNKFMKEIRRGKPIRPVKIPAKLRSILRPYQTAGIEWLYFLRSYNFAGILADDMGLGKTLQTLAILDKERVERKPSIVICPKTLLHNWQAEAVTFTPTLKTVIVDGTPVERLAVIKKAKQHDLLITGYATFKKDSEAYKKKKITFNYCVLDEAQFIKNHATKNAQIAKEVDARYRLALTGTPLENSVSEIWSIFDFLMPGFLGSYKKFAKHFHKPIMEKGDVAALELLRKKVECFMLRRTKQEVLTELPPKIEQESHCNLDAAQSILYQEVLARVRSDITKAVKEKGFNRSGIHILAGLTKLRQVCNHPNLLLKEKDYRKHTSAKLDMFNELVDEVRENKRKVLVFSQFTGMLDILAEELDAKNVPYRYLSGKTKKRHELVTAFNTDPHIPVFLISLKAGGTGLNLTSADTVIIFDPWWNPSVENQATDRAHRIGQKKSVNVYRLITKGTIEEKIVALQKKKRNLFDAVVGESKDLFKKLTWDDVQELFR